MKAALFLTMQIRFPWTDLFQISQNYETIIKIHNFARQMLQQNNIEVLRMTFFNI